MARKLSEIIAAMDAEQATQNSLTTLNSPSLTAIYTLWKYIVAVQMYLMEVLFDRKKAEIEDILANNVFGSTIWVRDKTLEFQYDATTPQVIQLVDMVPTYVPVDETLRIVTRCSVQSSAGTCTILVAKGDNPPEKLTTPEKDALTAYWNAGGTQFGEEIGIGVAGVLYDIESLDPDRLYIKADIYYKGTYANNIATDVIAKLEEYMANITFGGDVRTVDVVDYLQQVPGFDDIIINDLAVRSSVTPWASRTSIILANETLLKSSATIAGYVIQEDTATRTFTDELTFIAV
jgi:hypothetical protein